jgi:hypothetical protein
MAWPNIVSPSAPPACEYKTQCCLIATASEKRHGRGFLPVYIADRWENPLPDEPVTPIFAKDPEGGQFRSVNYPAPVVVRERISSNPRPVKSMLRRLSSRKKPIAVTFVDATRSSVTLPTSPTESLGNIISSYGNRSSDASPRTPVLSNIFPLRRFQGQIASRWSMSTAGDDMARAGLPTPAPVGLPLNPRPILNVDR